MRVILLVVMGLIGGCAAPSPQPVAFAGGVRALDGTWDGIGGRISGQVVLVQQGTAGDVAIRLPGAGGLCVGRFDLVKVDRGTWWVGCEDGQRAQGEFIFYGVDQPASGAGLDNRGAALRFTLGRFVNDQSAATAGLWAVQMRSRDPECLRSVLPMLGGQVPKAQAFCECRVLRTAYTISRDDLALLQRRQSLWPDQREALGNRMTALSAEATLACVKEYDLPRPQARKATDTRLH